jgi:hypothetical protein
MIILIVLIALGKLSKNSTCPYSYIELSGFTAANASFPGNYYTSPLALPYQRIINYINLSIPVTKVSLGDTVQINFVVTYNYPRQSDGILGFLGTEGYTISSTGVMTFSQLICRNMADVVYQMAFKNVPAINQDYQLSVEVLVNGDAVTTPTLAGYCLFI